MAVRNLYFVVTKNFPSVFLKFIICLVVYHLLTFTIANVWQPLFPGESAVDQLVEIIKVQHHFLLILSRIICYGNHVVMCDAFSNRFLVLQLEKKFDV